MRKFFLILIFLFFTQGFALSQNQINFIYINGSNTNDEKSKEWFYSGVEKFHKIFIKKICDDCEVLLKITKDNKLKLNNTPDYLYWGDLSKDEIETLNNEIDILKKISPRVAQFTRRFIAMCFHDAIWISKYPNMMPVLDMLNEKVKEANKSEDKIVLLGYSAGTFVTYQYFLTKMPVIKTQDMIGALDIRGKNISDDLFENKNTCLDALFRSDILAYNLVGGLLLNPDKQVLQNSIRKLDIYTKTYCAPQNTVIGVVNYASPIPLFYSDISDKKYKVNQIMTLSLKYIIENDIFYLTVNYADDPLGIPTSKNLNFAQTNDIFLTKAQPNGGFYYEKSDVASPRPFFAAHTSYWATARKFSNTIIKAYKEGYKFFYESN